MVAKKIKNKRVITIAVCIIIFIIGCSMVIKVNASSSFRMYMRHDCTDSDSKSYSLYALYTLPGLNYNNTDTFTVGNESDLRRDANQSVVSVGLSGSGFVVDDHIIATNAHCVYNWNTGEFYSPDIYIMSSGNTPIRTISPRYIHICRNYVNGGQGYNYKFDYAMIYVEENLSEYKINLGIMRDGYTGKLYASGFPVTSNEYGYRFKSSGVMNWNDTHEDEHGLTLWHTAYIAGGDSGGPLFIRENINNGTIDEEYAKENDIDNEINNDENYEISVVGINFSVGGSSNGSIKITEDLIHFYLNNNFVH